MNITEGLTLVTNQIFAFSWYDYLLFASLLGLSLGIGIYFGCFGSQQKTHDEYLLASKEMKVAPVAISLIASHLSGITLLAIPSEVYRSGATIFWSLLGAQWIILVTAFIFLPVFHQLQITTAYHYLEMRFDSRTRLYASFLFILSMLTVLPVVIYIPALAFSTSTGVSVHLIAPVLCGICIIYTTIGGVKAVIWSDTIQFVLTIGSVFAIFIFGVKSAGGMGQILSKAKEGERLDLLNFNLDPTLDDGFFQVVIGYSTLWCSHMATHQSSVQKFLTLPTLNKAKRVVFLYVTGHAIISAFCAFTGLIMYAKYADCDPYNAGIVKAKDGVLPYYVMDVAGHIPGLPGLFTAGVSSAALSTLSANLNCAGGAIYDDFICKIFKLPHGPKAGSGVIKIIVMATGIICTLLIFVVERMGGTFQLLQNITGATAGPLLALFTMGVLMPNVEKKGAFYGSIISLIVHIITTIMRYYYQTQGLLLKKEKPFSNSGCPSLYSNTTQDFEDRYNEFDPHFTPFILFRISNYYHTLLTFTITIVSACVISLFCKRKPVPKQLLSPVIHFMVPEQKSTKYLSVEKALDHLNQNVFSK